MLDRCANAALKPGLERGARLIVRAGVGADTVTWAGFGIGMLAAVAITQQQLGWSLALLLLSRLADGLDGAVARLTAPTDRGAFLDIALDFIF
jgi:phosphatidylglycerophosphate synthase